MNLPFQLQPYDIHNPAHLGITVLNLVAMALVGYYAYVRGRTTGSVPGIPLLALVAGTAGLMTGSAFLHTVRGYPTWAAMGHFLVALLGTLFVVGTIGKRRRRAAGAIEYSLDEEGEGCEDCHHHGHRYHGPPYEHD